MFTTCPICWAVVIFFFSSSLLLVRCLWTLQNAAAMSLVSCFTWRHGNLQLPLWSSPSLRLSPSPLPCACPSFGSNPFSSRTWLPSGPSRIASYTTVRFTAPRNPANGRTSWLLWSYRHRRKPRSSGPSVGFTWLRRWMGSGGKKQWLPLDYGGKSMSTNKWIYGHFLHSLIDWYMNTKTDGNSEEDK